jgi:hypothetical protein
MPCAPSGSRRNVDRLEDRQTAASSCTVYSTLALRDFVDVFGFTLQKHSCLPAIETLYVSAQLAIVWCKSCKENIL